MERHQRFERIERLSHGPGHGPQQNDPEVGVVKGKIVVACARAEDPSPASLLGPHNRPLLTVQVFELGGGR